MSIIFKRTKILASVGPPIDSPEMIEQMIRAGVNGFRFNFSHAKHEDVDRQIAWIREASERVGKPVAIVQDLQGPKIRLGNLRHEIRVNSGDILTMAYEVEHDGALYLPVQYNLAEKVQVNQPLYLCDGKIRTIVTEVPDDHTIHVRVENGGLLKSRKGINLPDTDFGGDILTPKDMHDIEYGATKDIDFVALSFVQSADDISSLRQILLHHGSSAQIIAKVETKAAIQDEMLERIVKVSDGVMVARGDLAVEAGAEVVPIAQRKILALCRKYGKLSIVATQMLASMVDSPEPTRAEVSDVALAVILGADTVMLSDETASGHYPLETVAAMKKIILYTQDNAVVAPIVDVLKGKKSARDAITDAVSGMASELGAAAIFAETKSGATASHIASNRPNLPIIAVTSEARSAQQLALSYATRSYIRPDGEKAGLKLAKDLKAEGFFGDEPQITVVIVSGKQPGVTGGTDTIRVRMVE
jgi:pyruvate kinase